ncbi:uncharacterized protein [Spinacia oleracea]|uniref:Uncharacterized protein isoform X2 n=1 Tax=Spinacia oleracea TaxID=3562 RepID=A0A9R0II63_SPIOL|nr:uncharacterized protein LOC110789396 isoform X2 [Spinacia oleracea]
MRDWMGRSYTFDIADPSQPIRTFRTRKPCHFIFEIESWVGLLKAMKDAGDQQSFETPTFSVGNETWSMIIYPGGHKRRGGTDHISLYLKRHHSTVARGRSINVSIKFFILDQPSGQYLVIEDLGERHFDARGTEWGIPQVLRINDFEKTTNGFLVSDQVTFGAEVFITSDEPTFSKLSQVKIISKRVFNKISFGLNFNPTTPDPIDSATFPTTLDGDLYTWKLQLFREGFGSSTGTHWSLFLVLVNTDRLSNGRSMLVSFELSLLSKNNGMYYDTKKEMNWLTGSKVSLGFPDFIQGSDVFTSPNNFNGGNTLDVKVQFNSIFLLNDMDG